MATSNSRLRQTIHSVGLVEASAASRASRDFRISLGSKVRDLRDSVETFLKSLRSSLEVRVVNGLEALRGRQKVVTC